MNKTIKLIIFDTTALIYNNNKIIDRINSIDNILNNNIRMEYYGDFVVEEFLKDFKF